MVRSRPTKLLSSTLLYPAELTLGCADGGLLLLRADPQLHRRHQIPRRRSALPPRDLFLLRLYELFSPSIAVFAIEKHMTVDSPTGGFVGSVCSDEGCTSYGFHVNDQNDNECAYVSGSKCQCGLMAFSPCNGCNR